MKLKVKSIEVEFSQGSFEEWANMMEENDPEDVAKWEGKYNRLIEEELAKIFPYAEEIEVGEGCNQLASTKFHIELDDGADDEFDYEFTDEYSAELRAREEVALTIQDICEEVADQGVFWSS